MSNNNFPFLIVSAVLIIASIALFYFAAMPQFEKIAIQEKEILDLEYKLENTTNYFSLIKKNAEKLEELEWDKASKKIDANFMDGPFFIHNMEAYFKNLIVRSGLYLKNLQVEEGGLGQNKTQEPLQGEGLGISPTTVTTTTKKVGVTFELSGEYEYFRNFLNILDRQALVIKVENIEINNTGSGINEDGLGQDEQSVSTSQNNNLSFKIKASISSK